MPEALSIGTQFLAAREARGLPLQQVAHETRIGIQRLREIEGDDFSHFSHPSYARMFLIDYAKYLRIPLSDIRDLLPAGGGGGAEGYQYLQESEERVIYRPIRPVRQRRLVPVLIGAVAAIILVIGGFELAVTLRKLDRLKAVETREQVVVPPVQVAPVVETTAPVSRPAAAFVLPKVGASAAIDESIINSDASVLNADPAPSAGSAPAVAPGPVSPLFVGGTVEHGGTTVQ